MTSIREVRQAARRAHALADPTRLSVALVVRDHPGELVDRLAEEVGRDQSLVVRHCQKLYEAGLLERFAKFRPHYRLSPYGRQLLRLVLEEPERH